MLYFDIGRTSYHLIPQLIPIVSMNTMVMCHGIHADIYNIPNLHREMLYFDIGRTSYHSIPQNLPIVSMNTMVMCHGIHADIYNIPILHSVETDTTSYHSIPKIISFRIDEYHGDSCPGKHANMDTMVIVVQETMPIWIPVLIYFFRLQSCCWDQ